MQPNGKEETDERYGSGTMREADIVFPTTRFSHVEKILLALDGRRETERENLVRITNLGRSVLSNAIPILKDLGVLGSKSISRDKLVLTPKGKELVQRIKTNKKKEINFLVRDLLENSTVLNEAYEILRNNPSVNSFELGCQLAEEFNKKWKHPNTYRVVGRSCKSLLNGFGVIKCQVTERPEREYGTQRHSELLPTSSSNKILTFLRKAPVNKPFKIPFEQKKVKQMQKFMTEFNSLVDLGLVRHVAEKYFELTEIGKKLNQAENPAEESLIFREILVNYEPALKVIKRLEEIGMPFGWHKVGEVIDECFGKKRKDSTLRGYGIKFLTWLKKADIIIDNDEYGKYRLYPLALRDFKPRPRTLSVSISPEKERKTRRLEDGYSKILEFNQHFADILANPLWYNNHRLKEEMKESLSQLKTISDGTIEILIDPVSALIDVAYERKDIELIRKIAKTGIRLREKYRDLDSKNRQDQ